MMDVAARQSVHLLEIERRDDLTMLDETGHAGRVGFERGQDEVGQRIRAAVP